MANMKSSWVLWAVMAAFALTAAACGDDGDGDSDAGADSDSDGDAGADGGDTEECTDADMYWIWDLSGMPPTDTQVCAHLRGEGANVHVLVADDAWGSTVDQGMVDNLIAAWDDATPADPSRGIFAIETAAFGQPPDVFDDDPKIWLFLYEMAGFQGYTFDGYFKVDDELDGATSNRHEMLHINSLDNPPDGDYSLSVQAHELQHLIHWGEDAGEAAWVNESLSELAMVLTGFGSDESWVSSWLNDPADPLMAAGPDYNYGVLLLFGDYLYERLGAEFVTALVADPAHGSAAIEAMLGDLGTPMAFADLLGDLGLAIAANDAALGDGEFGFDLVDIGAPAGEALSAAQAATVTAAANGGFAFVSSTEGVDGCSLRLETDSPDALAVRAAFTGESGSSLVEAALTGATTDVALGDWPAGAALVIAAANATSSSASLTATLLCE
jgi:hypothetical protein